LAEEETAKIQGTLAKKLEEIKKLADEVLEAVDQTDMEPQEREALE